MPLPVKGFSTYLMSDHFRISFDSLSLDKNNPSSLSDKHSNSTCDVKAPEEEGSSTFICNVADVAPMSISSLIFFSVPVNSSFQEPLTVSGILHGSVRFRAKEKINANWGQKCAICKWLDIHVFSDMDHRPYALCSQPKTDKTPYVHIQMRFTRYQLRNPLAAGKE